MLPGLHLKLTASQGGYVWTDAREIEAIFRQNGFTEERFDRNTLLLPERVDKLLADGNEVTILECPCSDIDEPRYNRFVVFYRPETRPWFFLPDDIASRLVSSHQFVSMGSAEAMILNIIDGVYQGAQINV